MPALLTAADDRGRTIFHVIGGRHVGPGQSAVRPEAWQRAKAAAEVSEGRWHSFEAHGGGRACKAVHP
jgi:hypothetical protein